MGGRPNEVGRSVPLLGKNFDNGIAADDRHQPSSMLKPANSATGHTAVKIYGLSYFVDAAVSV